MKIVYRIVGQKSWEYQVQDREVLISNLVLSFWFETRTSEIQAPISKCYSSVRSTDLTYFLNRMTFVSRSCSFAESLSCTSAALLHFTIGKYLAIYCGIASCCLFEIVFSLQILVATPGRLLDHIENKSGFSVRLMGLKLLILDEADHLLDLGFRKDIEKIVDSLPRQRQSLMFSATMPKEVLVPYKRS